MIFDNKNVVLLISSRKLLQRKKERINILCLNEKNFIVFIFSLIIVNLFLYISLNKC